MASKNEKVETKKERSYVYRETYKEFDLEVMEVFVIELVETVEQHISFFSTRLASSLALHEN